MENAKIQESLNKMLQLFIILCKQLETFNRMNLHQSLGSTLKKKKTSKRKISENHIEYIWRWLKRNLKKHFSWISNIGYWRNPLNSCKFRKDSQWMSIENVLDGLKKSTIIFFLSDLSTLCIFLETTKETFKNIGGISSVDWKYITVIEKSWEGHWILGNNNFARKTWKLLKFIEKFE